MYTKLNPESEEFSKRLHGNWTNQKKYQFPNWLNIWAWEFFRRNKTFQDQYYKFITRIESDKFATATFNDYLFRKRVIKSNTRLSLENAKDFNPLNRLPDKFYADTRLNILSLKRVGNVLAKIREEDYYRVDSDNIIDEESLFLEINPDFLINTSKNKIESAFSEFLDDLNLKEFSTKNRKNNSKLIQKKWVNYLRVYDAFKLKKYSGLTDIQIFGKIFDLKQEGYVSPKADLNNLSYVDIKSSKLSVQKKKYISDAQELINKPALVVNLFDHQQPKN